MRDEALTVAIQRCGGVNELARKLGITSASVAGWERLPLARVQEVAALAGMTPAELRPDLARMFAA